MQYGLHELGRIAYFWQLMLCVFCFCLNRMKTIRVVLQKCTVRFTEIISSIPCIFTFFSMLKTAFPLPGIETVNSLVPEENLTPDDKKKNK